MKMTHVRSSPAAARFLISVCCAGLLAGGCLSRPALRHENFALQDPPLTHTNAAAQGPVLQLQGVRVSPLFAGRALVYRSGQDSYEQDPYAGFMVLPERAITIPIRTYLRNSGLFKDVVEPGSPVKPDEFLELQVSELYGDFRKPESPDAVVTLRVVLFQPDEAEHSNILLNREYTRREPVKSNTAVDVVAGYDSALAQIMKDLVADLDSARPGH